MKPGDKVKVLVEYHDVPVGTVGIVHKIWPEKGDLEIVGVFIDVPHLKAAIGYRPVDLEPVA